MAVGMKDEVVGYEGSIGDLLNHWMTSADDANTGFFFQCRAAEAEAVGAFCQGGNNIQLRNSGGRVLQGQQLFIQDIQQLIVERFLTDRKSTRLNSSHVKTSYA